MTSVSFLSWNGRGFNIPHKRTSSLDFLRRLKIDIVLFQETHLLERDVSRFPNKFYHVIASSSNLKKKNRGVAIVAKRSLQFTILDTGKDSEGRVALIKTLINDKKNSFCFRLCP